MNKQGVKNKVFNIIVKSVIKRKDLTDEELVKTFSLLSDDKRGIYEYAKDRTTNDVELIPYCTAAFIKSALKGFIEDLEDYEGLSYKKAFDILFRINTSWYEREELVRSAQKYTAKTHNVEMARALVESLIELGKEDLIEMYFYEYLDSSYEVQPLPLIKTHERLFETGVSIAATKFAFPKTESYSYYRLMNKNDMGIDLIIEYIRKTENVEIAFELLEEITCPFVEGKITLFEKEDFKKLLDIVLKLNEEDNVISVYKEYDFMSRLEMLMWSFAPDVNGEYAEFEFNDNKKCIIKEIIKVIAQSAIENENSLACAVILENLWNEIEIKEKLKLIKTVLIFGDEIEKEWVTYMSNVLMRNKSETEVEILIKPYLEKLEEKEMKRERATDMLLRKYKK